MDIVIFDSIFVCNGHYNTPAIPNYPGRNLFNGQQIHSHDYRCPDPFKGMLLDWMLEMNIFSFTEVINWELLGETVLVIGAGPR